MSLMSVAVLEPVLLFLATTPLTGPVAPSPASPSTTTGSSWVLVCTDCANAAIGGIIAAAATLAARSAFIR